MDNGKRDNGAKSVALKARDTRREFAVLAVAGAMMSVLWMLLIHMTAATDWGDKAILLGASILIILAITLRVQRFFENRQAPKR